MSCARGFELRTAVGPIGRAVNALMMAHYSGGSRLVATKAPAANSIDHSSDAHDCSGCRDELRNYPEHADQNCHTQEAQTPEKRYPTEPVRSPHRFPTHGWTVTTIDSSRHEACDGRTRIGVRMNLPFQKSQYVSPGLNLLSLASQEPGLIG